jgi:hypothetical protein
VPIAVVDSYLHASFKFSQIDVKNNLLLRVAVLGTSLRARNADRAHRCTCRVVQTLDQGTAVPDQDAAPLRGSIQVARA